MLPYSSFIPPHPHPSPPPLFYSYPPPSISIILLSLSTSSPQPIPLIPLPSSLPLHIPSSPFPSHPLPSHPTPPHPTPPHPTPPHPTPPHPTPPHPTPPHPTPPHPLIHPLSSLFLTWEVPTPGAEQVPYWWHRHDDVEIISALCHKILPDTLLGRGTAGRRSLRPDLQGKHIYWDRTNVTVTSYTVSSPQDCSKHFTLSSWQTCSNIISSSLGSNRPHCN